MPGRAAVDWVRHVFLIIVSYAVQNKMADVDESTGSNLGLKIHKLTLQCFIIFFLMCQIVMP